MNARRSVVPSSRSVALVMALLLSACGEEAAEVVLGMGPVAGAGGRPEMGSAGGSTPVRPQASGGDGPLVFPRPPLCSASDQAVTELSKEMYILLDRSASMNAPLPAPAVGTWWSAARDAITSLVADPSLASAGVGLHLLPDASPLGGCSAGLGEPLVPIAGMREAAPSVQAAFAGQEPAGYLPDGYALPRHLAYLATRSRPLHHGALVVIASGLPPACATETGELAQEVQRWRVLASISTHAIALNVSTARSELDALARAGGIPRATFIDGGDVAARIHHALRSVLGAPHGCWYVGPPIPSGALPGTVMSSLTVTVTPRDGRPAHAVPHVGMAEDCYGEGSTGWYSVLGSRGYDIALCPQSCADAAGASLSYSYAYECWRPHPPGH